MAIEKPKLLSASFTFTQESNCLAPDDIEEIKIDCLSDLMIEQGKCFFVLKTESWSIDSEEELNDLISKVKSGLKQIS
jgi:hypothetical protein